MVGALPPTSYLPSIRCISPEDIESLNALIAYLRSVYNPEVRGSRRRKPNRSSSTQDSGVAKPIVPLLTDELTSLRSDPFERAYAIKWLTSLISSLDSSPSSIQEKETTIHNAASLLAICAGASAAGKVTRDFTFDYHCSRSSKLPTPLTIRITDISLDNDDFGSMGGQTWGGACVLSDLIAEDPESFGLGAVQLNTRGSDVFRILELGAGTGLVSITVGKMLQQIDLDSSQRIEIVATDYYPSVLENLRSNIQSNLPSGEISLGVSITVHPLDWSKFDSNETLDDTFVRPFDLVLGADVVYEPEHIPWIRSCLIHLLRKPTSSTEKSFFHLVVPLRSTHSFESNSIERVFATRVDVDVPSLQVVAKDTLICDTDTGEEVEYGYYKIGWI